MTHDTCNHEKHLEEIKKNLISESDTQKLSKLFKVLSDETRIKILFTISKHEVCVNDIANVLNLSQSAISHQLKTLKDANLIKSRREKQTIYYTLVDDHVHLIYNQALSHIKE
jgi:ArsR family transcriptional regulator